MSESFAERLRTRDARILARALSVVENADPVRLEWLDEVRRHAGRAFVLGVTGPPGAGKSTLVDRLIGQFREDGRTVAVLAIDPSSPVSGGALLGDRLRMQAHGTDAGVFVRSMASRGHAGGLASATGDAVTVLDAAGYDVIILETVGVGQADVAVVDVADAVVVTLAPGAGDDVQALKAGIMDVADVFAANKADEPNIDALCAAVSAGVDMRHRPDGWRPPVVQTVATTGRGVPELVTAIARFRDAAPDTIAGRRTARRIGPARAPGSLIDHVAVAAVDATPFLAFLRDHFGFAADDPEDVDDQGVRVRFVRAGETAIEVIEPIAPRSALAGFLDRRGGGLHHVALRVADLERTLRQLHAAGVRLIDERPRAGAGGARIAFVHPASAGGVLVELVERKGAEG